MVGFAVVVMALFLGGGVWYSQALAVKERVLGISTTAVDSLDDARDHLVSFAFEEAAGDFRTAQEAFQLALDEMNGIHRVVTWIPVKGGEVRSAEALLQAGCISRMPEPPPLTLFGLSPAFIRKA